MATRYAVRKISDKFDYLERWCVVEIRGRSVRRVRHSAHHDREEVQDHADRLNAMVVETETPR